MRSYKIQEVIKRRQIILVQVVKEERGSKAQPSPPIFRWPAATRC
jgi:Ribonuclease G/E